MLHILRDNKMYPASYPSLTTIGIVYKRWLYSQFLHLFSWLNKPCSGDSQLWRYLTIGQREKIIQVIKTKARDPQSDPLEIDLVMERLLSKASS